MPKWRIVTAIALAAPTSAAWGQDDFPVVDWGPTIHTEAMRSATDYAARQGQGTARQPSRSQSTAESARARATCAKARNWPAERQRDAQVSRLLSLCKRAGY